jgi:hypothetical protein
MFWEHSTIKQLVRLVTRPKYEGRKSGSHASDSAGERCGCCPYCQAFVRIGPAEDGIVPCPGCGRSIDSVEALGST